MVKHHNLTPPPYGAGGKGREAFFAGQLASWQMAHANYEALKSVQVKELLVAGIPYKVQFNPARIRSSAAKVDARSIAERPCFLCDKNRPEEQVGIPFKGHYQILLNPFPIFPRHLTITEVEHLPQRIATRFGDMLDLAKELTDFTIFYNGPRCGASAPDHMHFQAGNRGFMPIESGWKERIASAIHQSEESALYLLDDASRHTLVIESADREKVIRLFRAVYRSLPLPEGEEEPRMNILAMYEERHWIIFLLPRAKHRPACYTAEGDAQLLCSPASVDLGGAFILPREEDFRKITAQDIGQILSEVCLPPTAYMEQLKATIARLSE